MAKAFGILLMVVGIWVGLSIYTEGSDKAFGGMFAGMMSDPDSGPESGVTQAPLRERMNETHSSHMDRLEGALDRSGSE